MRKINNRRKILRHLRIEGHITPVEALVVHGIARLAPRIKELRDDGYRITSTMVPDVTGKRYCRYALVSYFAS